MVYAWGSVSPSFPKPSPWGNLGMPSPALTGPRSGVVVSKTGHAANVAPPPFPLQGPGTRTWAKWGILFGGNNPEIPVSWNKGLGGGTRANAIREAGRKMGVERFLDLGLVLVATVRYFRMVRDGARAADGD